MKYCSDRCRRRKVGEVDRKIERTFVDLLQGNQYGSGAQRQGEKNIKENSRTLVSCREVENIVFKRESSPTGDQKPEMALRTELTAPGMSLEGEASICDIDASEKTHSPSEEAVEKSVISGSVDANIKQKQGQRSAEGKETVKRAARRGCVFGFEVGSSIQKFVNNDREQLKSSGEKGVEMQVEYSDQYGHAETPKRRLCEAVMNGMVVEPSFAKGDWGIRWRE